MPKKQTLTVAELKSLLLARFKADQSYKVKLQARLQQELGIRVEEREPKVVALENNFAEWISDTLAGRLKRNRRSTPLLSYRDFTRFVPSIIDELDVEDRKMFKTFMKSMFDGVFEVVRASHRKNPYQEYWRWITTVLNIAAERDILPTELLAMEGATDEITRRMLTKKQFIALSKKVHKLIDIDVLRKIVIRPMLGALDAELDEEERQELEQALETELMPQMSEMVEKWKMTIKAWLDEEVERIYAVA